MRRDPAPYPLRSNRVPSQSRAGLSTDVPFPPACSRVDINFVLLGPFHTMHFHTMHFHAMHRKTMHRKTMHIMQKRQ